MCGCVCVVCGVWCVCELRPTNTECLVALSTNFVLQRRILLHNEELNDLYSLPNIVRVIKSRRMRWAGHVAPMGEKRGVYRVWVGKPE